MLEPGREPVLEFESDAGEIKIVLESAGTRGDDDLRRRRRRPRTDRRRPPARLRRHRRPRSASCQGSAATTSRTAHFSRNRQAGQSCTASRRASTLISA